jgi:hypothetical protein
MYSLAGSVYMGGGCGAGVRLYGDIWYQVRNQLATAYAEAYRFAILHCRVFNGTDIDHIHQVL